MLFFDAKGFVLLLYARKKIGSGKY